jgi:hypothetical protein
MQKCQDIRMEDAWHQSKLCLEGNFVEGGGLSIVKLFLKSTPHMATVFRFSIMKGEGSWNVDDLIMKRL